MLSNGVPGVYEYRIPKKAIPKRVFRKIGYSILWE